MKQTFYIVAVIATLVLYACTPERMAETGKTEFQDCCGNGGNIPPPPPPPPGG